MRYYEAEPRPRRAGAGVVIAIGIAIIAISAIVAFLLNRDDDDTGASSSTDSAAALDTLTPTSLSIVTTAPPATATVVLPSAAPETTTAVSLVDDCTNYVPTAIYFGDAEMQAFYDAAGGTPLGLVAACQSLAVDDPAKLQEMSDAFRALQDLAATTTTG